PGGREGDPNQAEALSIGIRQPVWIQCSHLAGLGAGESPTAERHPGLPDRDRSRAGYSGESVAASRGLTNSWFCFGFIVQRDSMRTEARWLFVSRICDC